MEGSNALSNFPNMQSALHTFKRLLRKNSAFIAHGRRRQKGIYSLCFEGLKVCKICNVL